MSDFIAHTLQQVLIQILNKEYKKAIEDYWAMSVELKIPVERLPNIRQLQHQKH